MPKFVLHEIDPFTGWEETRDPPVQLECHLLNLPRQADLHADFYKVRDSVTGRVVLEKLPMKAVAGDRVRVIDLYYGAVDPGQRESLFLNGDTSLPLDESFAVAERVIKDTLALRVDSPGVWFPEVQAPGTNRREDPVSMMQVGRIDYQFPNLVVRVNFLSNN